MAELQAPLDRLVSAHYSGARGESYTSYQLAAADVKARVAARKFAPHVRPTDTVVDFGCGPGHVLARLDVAQRIGVEPNPHTRSLAEAAGVHTVERTTQLPPESADVVISHHALEHTLSPFEELCALLTVLRPIGRLALVVPVDDWRVQRQPDPNDINHHLFTWTPRLLYNLLSEAGYRVGGCRVVRRTLPGRLTEPLGQRLPDRAFEAVMGLTAVVRCRPELHALAWPDPAASTG